MKKHIITDSREQKNAHILNKFKALDYNFTIEKMEAGDYSFFLENKDYREEFIIERKANWGEVYGNLVGKDRPRIKREFKRLEKVKTVILLIEEEKGLPGIDFMKLNNYKMDRQRLRSAYYTFIEYRNYERKQNQSPPIKVVFCNKRESADVILNLINLHLKGELSKLKNRIIK